MNDLFGSNTNGLPTELIKKTFSRQKRRSEPAFKITSYSIVFISDSFKEKEHSFMVLEWNNDTVFISYEILRSVRKCHRTSMKVLDLESQNFWSKFPVYLFATSLDHRIKSVSTSISQDFHKSPFTFHLHRSQLSQILE